MWYSKGLGMYLEVVITLKVLAWLHITRVELLGLWAGVISAVEKHILLDFIRIH